MANSDKEVLQVKNAVAVIANRYQQYMMGNSDLLSLIGTPSEQKFSLMVKFMDQQPFNTNLAVATFGRGRQKGNCTTNGFTSWSQNKPTIYVNRATAKPATIVHELLHLLTHKNFFDKFRTKQDIVEGMTEHFTRAVQKTHKDTHRAAFKQFLSSRKGHYDSEARAITQIDRQKLATMASTSHVMEKAFFKGDLSALDALQFALQYPEMVSRTLPHA